MFNTFILLCLSVLPYDKDTAAKIDAYNAGYEARWVRGLPKTANPYPDVLAVERDMWECGWSWNGWMPRDVP